MHLEVVEELSWKVFFSAAHHFADILLCFSPEFRCSFFCTTPRPGMQLANGRRIHTRLKCFLLSCCDWLAGRPSPKPPLFYDFLYFVPPGARSRAAPCTKAQFSRHNDMLSRGDNASYLTTMPDSHRAVVFLEAFRSDLHYAAKRTSATTCAKLPSNRRLSPHSPLSLRRWFSQVLIFTTQWRPWLACEEFWH